MCQLGVKFFFNDIGIRNKLCIVWPFPKMAAAPLEATNFDTMPNMDNLRLMALARWLQAKKEHRTNIRTNTHTQQHTKSQCTIN
jgi:hypothetical protein